MCACIDSIRLGMNKRLRLPLVSFKIPTKLVTGILYLSGVTWSGQTKERMVVSEYMLESSRVKPTESMGWWMLVWGKDGRAKGTACHLYKLGWELTSACVDPGCRSSWPPCCFQPFTVGSQDRDLTPLSLNRSKYASTTFPLCSGLCSNIPIDRRETSNANRGVHFVWSVCRYTLWLLCSLSTRATLKLFVKKTLGFGTKCMD